MTSYAKLILFSALIAGCSTKQKVLFTAINNPTYKCGGFTSTATNNKSLKDSVIVYGYVKACVGNYNAPMSVLTLRNENQEVIKTIITDVKGNFKIRVVSGTISISAANVSFGTMTTGLQDYLPGDSVKLIVYLSQGQGLNSK